MLEHRPPTAPTSFDERERQLCLSFARGVVQRRLTAAAIFFLESMRPMNFVASQGMAFFSPIVNLIFSSESWDEVQSLLEKREALPYIVDLIDYLEYRGLDGIDEDLV